MALPLTLEQFLETICRNVTFHHRKEPDNANAFKKNNGEMINLNTRKQRCMLQRSNKNLVQCNGK